MVLLKSEFQKRRSSYFGREEDEEEEELKPSQIASLEQRRKQFYQEEEKRVEIEKAKKPSEPEPEPEKKSFFKKATEAVKKFLVGEKVEKTEKGRPTTVQLSDDEYVSVVGKVREYRELAVTQLEQAKTERQEKYFGKGQKIAQTDPVIEKRIDALEWAIGDYDEFLGNEPADRGFLREFWKGIKKEGISPDFYESLLPTAQGKAINKYTKGEELSQEEQGYVNSFRATKYNELIKKGYGEQAASVLAGIPKYAMLIWASLQGVKPITTGVGLKLEALPEGFAKSASSSILKNSISQALASNWNIPGMTARTAEYMLPTVDYEKAIDSEDILKNLKPGDAPMKAQRKAYLTNLVEYISEGAGGYIDDALPFVKKAIIGRWLSNRGVDAANPGLIKTLLRKANFNSLAGEVFEEEIAEPVQAIIEEREYYDPLFTPEGRERLLVETLGIGAFSGMARVSDIVINTAQKRRQNTGDVIDIPTKADVEVEEEKPVEPKIPTVITEEIAKGVKPLGESVTVFRGAKDHAIDVTRAGGITKGVSFSTSKDVAERFAEKAKGTVEEYEISEDAKVINHSELEKMSKEEVVKFLEENKVDVVRFDVPEGAKGEGELRVINDEVLVSVKEVKPPVEKPKLDWEKLDKEKYSFCTDCTTAEVGDKIEQMVDQSEDISYKKFVEVVGEEVLKEQFPAPLYDWEGMGGLEMKDDYAVSFNRSVYDGKPAYYVVHSAIEYVFTGESEIKEVKPPVKKPPTISEQLKKEYKKAEPVLAKKLGRKPTQKELTTFVVTQREKLAKAKLPVKKPMAIPEGLEAFAVEARKYKSAEKFIEGIDPLEIHELAEDIAKKARLAKEPWAKTEYGYSPKVQRIAGEKAKQQLKDLYAQVTKVKVAPKKPPVKPRVPKKPKKAKPPTKPAKIKLRKVKKPKARVFMASARKQLQQEVKEVVAKGKTQEESVGNVDKFLASTFNQADDPLYERKLKTIRAELKRNMYELVGATTGNWKKDYAYFQKLRDNPDIVDLVNRMEEGIFQIDDIVNPTPPPSIGFATTGTKPVGEFEKRVEPRRGTDEFKLFEKTKELTRKYAKTIGEGYTPRKTLGVYYPKTKNIFVNALNNLSTVAHEITHFLDKTHNISDKLLAIKGFAVNGNPIYDPATMKYRKAITNLYTEYYAGGKKTHKLRKRTLEGFATLLQKYVESPQRITEQYPLLVNDFLKEGGKYYHPVMGEIIKDLNAIVKEYQGLSSLDKVGSRVVTGDAKVDKSSFLNVRDKIRTFMADELYPIEVLAKKSDQHFTKADPSLWLRAYNNVSGIINKNISGKRGYWTFVKGDIKKVHDFNWKTLHDSLETAKNTDDFNYYLVSRREHFSYKELDVLKEEFLEEVKDLKIIPKNQRHIKDSDGKSPLDKAMEAKVKYLGLKELLIKDGFVRSEVDGAYLQNKERFTKEEKMFDALTKEDLKFLSSEEVQLITPKQYVELTSKQGYASFKRQFYNEVIGENNEIPIQTKVGRGKISSLLKRKGSEQAIVSPLTSAILNHSEIMRKGLRQVVYNKVTDIGISAAFPNVFQELDLKVSIDSKTGAFFYPQEKDPNIIMGRLNYKRQPVLVAAEIKNVLDNVLTYRNVDIFARIYTGLSRLFTAGTTGYYPPFAIVNLLRDQITAQANTVNKYKTLYSPIKEFGKVLRDKNSEEYGYYEEYMVMGGERQTFTGWQRLPPDKLAQRIRDEKSGIKKSIALMEKGTNILSAPAKYSEIVTRATEYINARKAGKSTIVALEEAGRLTAPFHHLGSWGGRHGQIFIRGIPYFNAALQVLDQHARVATTPDGRKRMLVVLSAITAAYLASMMALLDADDEQKEQYKDLKPEELARYLYFPHPSGKRLWRIPMSEVFTTPGTIFNMIIADEFMGAKYTQSDYIHAATAILPDQFDPTEPIRAFLSWMPQVFKRGIETALGVKSYPEVSPLESMSLKNLPPELRVNRSTSAFAKWLGKRIGLSPIKIDYLIIGYIGRGANIALGKPDAWNFEGSVLRDYWFSYGRRVSGAYDKREENDQEYTAYQRGAIELTDDERDEVYRVKMITNDFMELMGEFRDADIGEDEEKAAEIRTDIILLMNKIETGERLSGFTKWKRDAKKRRKIKIKELGN
jgi:hypothetical protein